jgi:OFA family oxalate/formate antiporter-like MFS transporter
VGNAVKWFPDRRGLAAGFTAAGFGAGAAITVIPIASMIQTSGYEATFRFFGILQSVVIIVLALFLNNRPRPPKGVVVRPRVVSAKYNKSMAEMVRTPAFWLMYICFVGVGSGGMMAVGQLGLLAKDYGLAKIPVDLFVTTLPLLTAAASIDNICNGATRPFFGWVSDNIGRENTMLIVFGGEALALWGMMLIGKNPYGFMLCAALIFGFWGEIFSLFPSMNGDTYGIKNAAGNAGALYTAKGVSGFFVPLTSVISAGGNWDRVFILSGCIALTCSLLAFFVLKQIRAKYIQDNNAIWEADQAKAATAAQA